MSEILDELKVFEKFKFYPEDHHYECDGKQVGISVTKLIEEYANEFDMQGMAEKVATRDGREVTDVISEWNYKNKFACEKGSTCHEYAQSRWSLEEWRLKPFDKSLAYLSAVDIITNQADNFYCDFKDRLEHLADEFVIGSDEYDIASAVDHLFINKLTGDVVLVDYKTNSKLGGYNDDGKQEKYAKQMKVPLQHLKDLTINHYYIQLSIYKFLIEKYTNVEIKEMFIVYMSENIDNYEIIEVPYLKKEVENILEMRRVKNMNSVPVLLIGKSGSGKSASMRNFKKEDIAIVNVLGKPLPFKNDLNAPKCDNYVTDRKSVV